MRIVFKKFSTHLVANNFDWVEFDGMVFTLLLSEVDSFVFLLAFLCLFSLSEGAIKMV